MFQVIISLFLVINISNAFDEPTEEGANTEDHSHDLSLRITEVKSQLKRGKDLIQSKHLGRTHCSRELENIQNFEDQMSNVGSLDRNNDPDNVYSFISDASNQAQSQLKTCLSHITTNIEGISHPVSKESWYNQHLAGKKYLKDFERYPELEGQFNSEMDTARRQLREFNASVNDLNRRVSMLRRGSRRNTANRNMAMLRSRITANNESILKLSNYIETHPYFKENYSRFKDTLPYRYNAALAKLKEAKTCKPKKTESCFEKLKGQLAEDSEDSLKGMCNQALQEGQVCCANPNKSCGDLAFAKDITRTFAQNLPGVGQAFANLAAIKGNMAEACKLSQLGAVVGPLGNLQLNSCNKAIDGCRETCQSRLDKFKQDFKKCYNISEKESLSEVIRKASLEREEEDEADPRSDCQEQIKKIAELYKQGSLESRYSLKEDSDHEELVSCYGEIEQYAPGGNNRMARQGGMDPTQQLAVNMCYSQLGGSSPPSGPPTMPRNPVGGSAPISVGGFAGGGTTTVRPPASTYNEGDSPLAGRDIGDEIDSPMGSRMKPTGTNELKFRPPQNEGGPGGGGALAGGGTGGSTGGGDGKGNKQAGASGGIGSGKQLPFYTGDVRDGTSNGDSWGPEADSKYLRHKRKAEQLKKLPRKYLTEDERDLVKMFSPPGKYESIFERASFALHWFCRHYGCVGYNEAMGITYPEIDPYSFLLLPEPANAL